MSTDPDCAAKQAYIAYVKEKSFPPQNATQLVKFSKLHQPPFVGVKFINAKKVLADPPSVDQDDGGIVEQAAAPTTATSAVAPTQSKIADAYDLYTQVLNAEPKTAMQFADFCQASGLNFRYYQCAQYIQHRRPTAGATSFSASAKLKKKKFEAPFNTNAWAWSDAHHHSLYTLEIPSVIVGLIESYVWTSAIVLEKAYPNTLLTEFEMATQSSQYGYNPRNPLNILILGANKVGKTNIVSRYYANAFVKIGETEGMRTETTRKMIDLELDALHSTRLYLRLYDTVGFSTMSGAFKTECVRNAHCILIAFDVSNQKTYSWIAANHIMDQLMTIKCGVAPRTDKEKMKELPVVIVGTKIDEVDNNIDDSKRTSSALSKVVHRVVPTSKLYADVAYPYHAPYIEISAKCSTNVDRLFEIAVKEAMVHLINNKI